MSSLASSMCEASASPAGRGVPRKKRQTLRLGIRRGGWEGQAGLFGAQRLHGIDGGAAAGGDEAGQQRHRNQQAGDDRQGGDVPGTDAEE